MTFPDFEEFIESLNAHKVRYLIVGGYAVGYHARPRATKDIDILVDRSPANARRTRTALRDFLGGDAPNITIEKLTNPRTLVVLGVSPIRIDVLTSVDGISSFAGAWKRRSQGKYGKVPANFVSLADLMASKAAAGRPQDLADLEVLEKVSARRNSRKRRP